MHLTTLSPVGGIVTGIQIDALSESQVGDFAGLLAEHGVFIMPGSDLGDEAFLTFLRSFGELMFTVGETPVAEFPDLNIVSNVGRATPPRSSFHTDTSYVRRPPAYTALRAVTVPQRGGHTVFTNQYRAYETLPPRIRESLHGRTITHVVTGLELPEDAETSALHPIFLRHPISGRTALYLSTPQRCAAISGMAAEEAAKTIAYLLDHSTHEDNVFRHSWSPGDIVIWDNRCVLHRADHTDVAGDRVLHRGMVAAPVLAW